MATASLLPSASSSSSSSSASIGAEEEKKSGQSQGQGQGMEVTDAGAVTKGTALHSASTYQQGGQGEEAIGTCSGIIDIHTTPQADEAFFADINARVIVDAEKVRKVNFYLFIYF